MSKSVASMLDGKRQVVRHRETVLCGSTAETRVCTDPGPQKRGKEMYLAMEGCRGGAAIYREGGLKMERDCKHCIWRSEDGCTRWNCEYVSRKYIRDLIEAGEITPPPVPEEWR